MPPSPQPDYSQSKPSTRRATSLPPVITRRSSTPISLFKQIRLTDDEIKEGGIEIEELSPEAIIPDSVTVMRDPEIEVPDDEEGPTEAELENKFTEIKLDRMHDGSHNEEEKEEQEEADIVPLRRSTRKRKYTPMTDEESQEEQRSKRTVRSRTFPPLRGNN
jgi:hypothetical protein